MFVWLLKVVVVLTVVSWVDSTLWRVLPVFGAALPQTSYATCKELRQDYPFGLAASRNALTGADARSRARPFAQAYVLNMHLDSDHDGVVCTRWK